MTVLILGLAAWDMTVFLFFIPYKTMLPGSNVFLDDWPDVEASDHSKETVAHAIPRT